MIWGYGFPWYGEFMTLDEDPLYARLKFLLKHELNAAQSSIRQVAEMDEAERDRLGRFLADNNLQIAPHVGFDYLAADDEEIERQAEQAAEALDACLPLMRGTISTTVAGVGHRFDRTMPLEEKLDRLSRAMAPLAAACAEAGAPLCVENHGDYYVSDLVDLCKRTPDLHIFLDTGNTCLIGEKPLPAFEEAAPYTLGAHFKDHRVRPRPEARPLHFEVSGSALGEGDVPLRECHELLLRHAPAPDRLVMFLEMICPEGMTPTECLGKSLAFIRSLPE